jgi:Zn-dependent peptidase ImmA (M78 family)/transcriptional regulator with XRE-family HTH domain
MQHFNPGMLTLARESRELTQAELAHLIGIPQAIISRLEGGITQPSTEQIAAMADGLSYPQELFFQEDRIFGFNASVFFHRKRADMPAKTLRRIHSFLNLTRMRVGRLMLATSITSDVELIRMPVEEHGTPERIAQHLRALLHIPPGPIKDLTSVIEDAGVVVVSQKFGSSRTDAVSEWVPGHPPIVLMNADESVGGDRYRWTLAHELGHLIMHKLPSETMEEEANRFASELLLPAAEIKHQLRNVRLANLALLKRIWKVSMGALLERAKQLGTINATQYRYMRINFSKLHYNTNEPPELDFPLERPTLLPQLVSAHLQDLNFSLEDLARLLNLKAEECSDLYAPELGRNGLRLITPPSVPRMA